MQHCVGRNQRMPSARNGPCARAAVRRQRGRAAGPGPTPRTAPAKKGAGLRSASGRRHSAFPSSWERPKTTSRTAKILPAFGGRQCRARPPRALHKHHGSMMRWPEKPATAAAPPILPLAGWAVFRAPAQLGCLGAGRDLAASASADHADAPICSPPNLATHESHFSSLTIVL